MSLLPRQWKSLLDDGQQQQQPIRVMSFNMLADGLAQHGAFAYAPPHALEWNHRFALIKSEIQRIAPDLVGLAECCHFDDAMVPFMQSLGLVGAFVPKAQSPAVTMIPSPGSPPFPPDGVALFWRESQWHAESVVSFDTDPVQLLAVLRHRQKNFTVLLSMMHLKAKNHAERRKAQATTALQRLRNVASQAKDTPEWIVCGDLNAEPHEEAVSCLREAGLVSAYCAPWTTWKVRRQGRRSESPDPSDTELCEKKRTIDYIFVPPSLRTTAVFWTPTDEDVGASALPQLAYPSDHLALAIELATNDKTHK